MKFDFRVDNKDVVKNMLNTQMGLLSGIKVLDEQLLGFFPGELIIIAGRPSMGKSSLARDITLSIGKERILYFFCFEGSVELISEAITANLAKVNFYAVRRGEITEQMVSQLDSASAQLSTYGIIIEDDTSFTPSCIRNALGQHKETISCVIVDYLQLISTEEHYKNRQEAVEYISKELKAIAKEFNLPVIALCQLNRQAEHQESTRPRMSNLRNSGAMEQDADKVILLHRPSYYTKMEIGVEDNGEAEFIIEKNRCGPVGIVKCGWIAEWMSFRDIPKEEF